jgi:transcriptional regulator with XRE-family HTH domain
MFADHRNPESPANLPPRARAVAERVRAARLAAGLSQFHLAARVGLSLQTVGLVERGGIITKATAEKLAGVLGIAAEELLP